MSEIVASSEMLDPHLQKMLNAYGVVPKRDPQAAERTREKFISELNLYIAEPTIPRSALGNPVLAAWMVNLMQLKSSAMPLIGKRAIVYPLIALMVFIVFLSGSVGITAYAASISLPGDAMYPLKTTFEDAQVGLAGNPEARASLSLEFAARRLAEMHALIDAGRYADISQAAHEFENDVQMALRTVESLWQTDPDHAVDLNVKIAAILRGYTHILSWMLAGVPADVRPAIQNAINTSNPAGNDASESSTREDKDDDEGTSTPLPIMSPTPKGTTTSTPTTASTATSTPGSTVPTDLPTSTLASPPTSTPALPPNSSVVEGADATCTDFIGAITVNNLEVPQGTSCTLDGTIVMGNILVRPGATLMAQRVTVNGDLQAEGAAYIEVLAGSRFGGSLQLKQGGSARVEGASVNGDVQLESNAGTFSILWNWVGGNIQVFQNNGGITISDNSVNGNLQCKENTPAPIGGQNVVQGNKEDQCASL